MIKLMSIALCVVILFSCATIKNEPGGAEDVTKGAIFALIKQATPSDRRDRAINYIHLADTIDSAVNDTDVIFSTLYSRTVAAVNEREDDPKKLRKQLVIVDVVFDELEKRVDKQGISGNNIVAIRAFTGWVRQASRDFLLNNGGIE